MRAYCFKCKRITLGCRDGNFIKLVCGCKINYKNIEKYRVIQKTRYFLQNGKEIIKIPNEKVRWELLDVKDE